MTFPVIIEGSNGHFKAMLCGSPAVQAEGATRDAAVDAIRGEIRHAMDRGEIVMVDVDLVGISGLAGKYRDDPFLQEICDEIYRQRGANRDAYLAELDRDDRN